MLKNENSKCLLASTSTLYRESYLGYLLDELKILFKDVDEILFIPYARPGGISHDLYTDKANKAFAKIGKRCVGLHTFSNPKQAIAEAQGIFTGGGNSFVLLDGLYKNDLMEVLKSAIFEGTPYLGTSAGSNIAGLSIQTTNDMPIIYPPSFGALKIIPFLINPHYLDANPETQHMGETRETRLKEFLTYNHETVVGLREGSWLEVKQGKIVLKGELTARLFYKNAIEEVVSGFDFNQLNFS